MTFRKNQYKTTSRRHPTKCNECGKVFEVGDIYYSVISNNRSWSKTVTHICEACYEAKFIDVSDMSLI